MARHKTEYPGVFYKTVRRLGGRKGQTERSYYIIYKKNGKNIEEHVGYQFRDDLTPSRVSKIRGERFENKRRSRKEIRKKQERQRDGLFQSCGSTMLSIGKTITRARALLTQM